MNSTASKKKLISELKRVCEELKKVPREFTSLDLSQCNLNSITKDMRKRFGEFARLAELILYDCGLTNLADLPAFPQLRSLSLIGNNITDKEVIHLTKYPRLSKLVLTDNDIQSLDVFTTLGRLRSLEHLQLESNPVSDLRTTEQYREWAFKCIQPLKSLDGYDIEGMVYVSPSDLSDEIVQEEQQGSEEEEPVHKRGRKRANRYEEEIEDQEEYAYN